MPTLLTHEEYNAIAADLSLPLNAYVNGKFSKPRSGKTMDTVNPATGESLGKMAACDSSDVDCIVFFGDVIDWQIDSGTHGIIVGGSTGEFFALSQDERVEQFQFAAERIGGRVALIAGVNDLLPDRCYELTAAAKKAGADALLVAPPPYSLPSQKELVAHYLSPGLSLANRHLIIVFVVISVC